MIGAWVVWLVIAIIMFVIEVVTTGLATLWFALGAIVAMVMDLCGAPLASQIIVMAIVSVVSFILCMIWVRPKLETLRKKNVQRTNADRLIGRDGVVIVPPQLLSPRALEPVLCNKRSHCHKSGHHN